MCPASLTGYWETQKDGASGRALRTTNKAWSAERHRGAAVPPPGEGSRLGNSSKPLGWPAATRGHQPAVKDTPVNSKIGQSFHWEFL